MKKKIIEYNMHMLDGVSVNNIITDAQTVAANWRDLMQVKNCVFHLSVATILEAKKIFPEILKIATEVNPNLPQFMEDTALLRDKVLYSEIGDRLLQEFIASPNPIGFPIALKNNCKVQVYKGFKIDVEDPEFKFAPWLEEPLARAYWQIQRKEPYLVVTSSDLFLDFIQTSQLPIPVMFLS